MLGGVACFNPRPRRGAGATKAETRIYDWMVVSILARAEARALHGNANSSSKQEHGFNPRPRRGAGATSSRAWNVSTNESFNPRPRRGAGATQVK